MIPLGDDNPTKNKPYIVYAIVIINVVVFILDLLSKGQINNTYSLIPYSALHNIRVGIVSNLSGQHYMIPVQGVQIHPQWLTIFTSMFLHGSFVHIAGNMVYLLIFGNNIEDVLGRNKFIFFYITCGIGAAAAQIFSNINSPIPMVGASGAIAGVLGAYLVLFPGAAVTTLLGYFVMDLPAFIVLGVWFLTQLTGVGGTGGQIGGGVAYWAHIGGFVTGVILILMLGGRNLLNENKRQRFYRLEDL